MSENTKIEWCDYTFNPWWGCTKVDPGCDHCYAATWARRFGVEWGVGAERRYSSEAVWQQPHKWNRAAAYHPTTVLATGEAIPHAYRPRVFVASMGDVLDKAVPQDWRERLWTTIEDCPALDWLILTKRPQLIRRMKPDRWWGGWPRNIWLGVSVSDNRGRWRIPYIMRENVAVRFVSYEPALGPLDVSPWLYSGYTEPPQTDVVSWVIAGGESGPGARPCRRTWIRDVVQQCRAAGKAVFVKQLGAWQPCPPTPIGIGSMVRAGDVVVTLDGRRAPIQRDLSCTLEGEGAPYRHVGGKGNDMEEWPADLRVREFPVVRP